MQGLAREVEGKTRGFVVMEGSGKLHFKKEGIVNNQCPLDFITSKSLVFWGRICSICVLAGGGGLDYSVMMSGGVGHMDVETSFMGDIQGWSGRMDQPSPFYFYTCSATLMTWIIKYCGTYRLLVIGPALLEEVIFHKPYIFFS